MFLALATSFLLNLMAGTSPALQVRRPARVIEVNDGDTVTLRMDGKTYRTRLIGMDAPEMGQEPWGRKARQHLIGLIRESGWTVDVETDVRKYDKYGRLLVYLWSRSGHCLNERMILEGYAVLFIIRPNVRYAEQFRTALSAARRGKLGIWGADGLQERPRDYKKTHPGRDFKDYRFFISPTIGTKETGLICSTSSSPPRFVATVSIW